VFDGAAQGGAKFVGFELAEGGLPVALKELRDGDAGGGFDAFVEIHETPAELAGKARANGAFAGAHETGETEDGDARRHDG
jgi:hypothetical protein